MSVPEQRPVIEPTPKTELRFSRTLFKPNEFETFRLCVLMRTEYILKTLWDALKFLLPSVNGKHLMRFQSEKAIFNFLRPVSGLRLWLRLCSAREESQTSVSISFELERYFKHFTLGIKGTDSSLSLLGLISRLKCFRSSIQITHASGVFYTGVESMIKALVVPMSAANSPLTR